MFVKQIFKTISENCFTMIQLNQATFQNKTKFAFSFKHRKSYFDNLVVSTLFYRYFPEGIDIYFDNVGAEMLEAAVANMKTFGRVAACGVISEYSDPGKRAAPDMLDVVYKRIKMQGFLAADHLNVYQEFLQITCDHLLSGKIKVLEDISDGVESIPSAFVGLFRGDNIGKKVVRIDHE